MSDWAHIKTDEALAELEKRIRKLYADAAEELQGKIDDYFAHLAVRDEKQRALLKDGKITPQQYKRWRLNQIARGKRYEALRDDVAQRMNQANQAAFAYINDSTPGIYSLNHNYAAYEIEQVCGNVGFTLYDEQTIRRLIAEDPELFPAPRVDIPKDLRWNCQRIATELTSGILQGESIGKIATRFQRVIDMNRTAAIRNARTAFTGEQNAGRLESYNRAKALGIEVKKEWLATLDKRTRHSHAMLDGEAVATDKKFSNGCRFPGDPQGPPREVYNCRCTLVASLPDVDTSDAQRRARNPITGESEFLPADMTYQKWVDWKASETAKISAESDAEALNFFSADARDDLKSIVKRSTIKLQNGFACFPDGDVLNANVQAVKPLKTFFDVAMHGSPTAVGFGSTQTNMSPRTLAAIIRHSEGYHGQKIRLLSCSTGKAIGNEYCFAEELANALGVEVRAPNDVLYISKSGTLIVGRNRDGEFVPYKPNQRRRFK